jgi:uncharacterized membrane-anchored protein
VLSEAWGNPPAASQGVLGMIFPAHMTPYDDTWGAAIYFEQDGYVTDEGAADIDYDELLETMQADTLASNTERERLGYERVTLVGWAARPFYDSEAKKLHWAKELQFGDSSDHTLNYDVRVLGRRGVFSMNFITTMADLPLIEGYIPRVMAMPAFNDGARYIDYVPSTDQVAAYGIGGLIAGKVLAKAGILAIVLAFLKKGWIVVVIAGGALWAGVRKMFSRS